MQDTSLVLSFLASSLVRLFQILRQAIERALPEFSILFDPAHGLLHWFCFQIQLVDATVAPASKEPGLLENAQMFGNRRERHRVGSSEIGDAAVPSGEVSEDAPAGRVGQGGEGPV